MNLKWSQLDFTLCLWISFLLKWTVWVNIQSFYKNTDLHVLTIHHSCAIILFWLTETWINWFTHRNRTSETPSVFLKPISAVTPQAHFNKNRAVCSFFLSFNLLFHFIMALYKIIKADAVTCFLYRDRKSDG